MLDYFWMIIITQKKEKNEQSIERSNRVKNVLIVRWHLVILVIPAT